MEAAQVVVCRLCFKICKDGFQFIESAMQDMLKSLQMNLDLEISNAPVICNNCIDNLKECFNIRTRYTQNHEALSSEKINETSTNNFFSSTNVCCFCTKLVNNKSFVLLINKETNIVTTLEQYFPQLAVNVTKDTIMCTSCYKALQNYLTFVSNCLAVEESIKEFCRVKGMTNKPQIELNSVLSFMLTSEYKGNHSIISEVKREDHCGQTENEDVKVEIKTESFARLEDEELNLKMEDTDTKAEPECDSIEEDTISAKQPKVSTYKCNWCVYETIFKRDFKKHVINHENSEATVYKCELCRFETKHSDSLSKHLKRSHTSEPKFYECALCSFRTNHKGNLPTHMLTHKSISEVVAYKCEVCTYQSKHKSDIRRHTLIHKNPSDIKHKKSTQLHTLKHVTVSKAAGYKCEICTFETKHKKSLLQHIKMHKCTVSEAQLTSGIRTNFKLAMRESCSPANTNI